jgi:hypothetical protein
MRSNLAIVATTNPSHATEKTISGETKKYFGCEAVVARLKAKGIQLRNEIMDFHNRKLVFLSGPEGITVELAEWDRSRR